MYWRPHQCLGRQDITLNRVGAVQMRNQSSHLPRLEMKMAVMMIDPEVNRSSRNGRLEKPLLTSYHCNRMYYFVIGPDGPMGQWP